MIERFVLVVAGFGWLLQRMETAELRRELRERERVGRSIERWKP